MFIWGYYQNIEALSPKSGFCEMDLGNTAHFMDTRHEGENFNSYVAVRNAIYLQNVDLKADALKLIIENNLSAEDGLVQN